MPLLLALLALLLLAALPAAAAAAPTLDRVGSFQAPVYVTSPPGDGRLFVVEREGRVRIVGANGTVKPAPFLDVAGETTTDGERGLLSIAFPPDYASSGLFYAYLTASDGAVQVREFRRSQADPNRADGGAGRVVISQAHAEFGNHNGGTALFGPDGLLYLAIGDGGSRNDPNGNGQKLSTLLGKMLRIDPRATPAGPYSVPGDNPFVGRADARPEIWMYGLRNPYRFSFDRQTGDLFIGDVGQGAREEIDFAARGTRGQNYGWRCFEGSIRTPGMGADCQAPGAVAPFLDRDHEADGVSSITGGVVARDPGLPTLDGRYLHGDLSQPAIRAVLPGDASSDRNAGISVSSLVAIGEDACGRVYTVSIEGPVSRIRDGAATACNLPEAPAAPPGEPGASTPTVPAPPVVAPTDRTGCRLTLRRRSPQRLSARRVRVTVTANESCAARARLRIKGVATLRSAVRTLEAERPTTVTIRIAGPGASKLRRAVRRRSRLAVLTVGTQDRAGNASSASRRLRLRR